jgi:hypothetical protein
MRARFTTSSSAHAVARTLIASQFYPKIAEESLYLLQIDCDTESDGMKINENFYGDFEIYYQAATSPRTSGSKNLSTLDRDKELLPPILIY